MPPKKKKDKKKAPPPPPPPDPLAGLEIPEDTNPDFLTDLNTEFFSKVAATVKLLAQSNRQLEAGLLKYYVHVLEKLHRRFIEEYELNEKLKPQIVQAKEKLRYALEISASSEDCMQRIKTELSDAWKEVDESKLIEQNMQDKMQEMYTRCLEIDSKEKEDREGEGESGGALGKYKNIILRERDRLNAELLDFEKRLQIQRAYSETLEYVNAVTVEEKNKLANRERALNQEKDNLEKRLKGLQFVIDDLRQSKHMVMIKLDDAHRLINDLNDKLVHKTSEYDRSRLLAEKFRSEGIANRRQIIKNEDEMKGMRKDLGKYDEMLKALRLEDKIKDNLIRELQKKYKTSLQENSAQTTRLYQQNRANLLMQNEITRLKNEINSLGKDIMNAMTRNEDLRILKENIQRERDMLRSDVIKINNNMADLRHTIVLNGITIDGLNLDIKKLNVKLDDAKNLVSKAERERDEMAQEIESLHLRMEYLQDTVQLKTEQLTVLTEQFENKQKMLINVKKQLEAVHSEKMILKRALETSTQERDDFKNLNLRNSHQIAQMSTEINANLSKINSMNLRIERLNADKKELQNDLKFAENTIASMRRDIKALTTKNESLSKTITEDEMKFLKIKQELEETRKERNLVGLQMVRRNDEITLVKEKMSIMQNALDNGTAQYNQRVEDIRLMKVEISNLQTERECLSRAMKSTAIMREEIVRLQRKLNQENIRVRTLMEDAKTPTGVHRWRILKGEDPQKYILIRRVQILQKRNICIGSANANLQTELLHMKNMYETLKEGFNALAKSDANAKLVKQQRINLAKNKKLKALTAELRIHEVELESQKCKFDELKTQGSGRKSFINDDQMSLGTERSCKCQSTNRDKKEACMEIALYSMSQQDLLPLCVDSPETV